MKNYFDLKGQVAIVTGCSTGLGVQMAKAFANQGCNIVAVARRANLIEEVAASIASEYGEVFRKLGIPFFTKQTEGFYGSREVTLILEMLTVIDNPHQDIPLAGVLLSPIAGLSEEDLSRIFIATQNQTCDLYDRLVIAADHPDSLPADDSADELVTRIRIFLEFLRELREEAPLSTVSSLLDRFLGQTGLYEMFAAQPDGKRRCTNIDYLMHTVNEFDRGSFQGVHAFIEYIHRITSRDEDAGEPLSIGDADDVVRLMSVHKSKGLEFPVVIIPRMDSNGAGNQSGRFITDPELGLAGYLDNEEKGLYKKPVFYALLRKKCEREDRGELLRLFYVAMTRAKDQLILIREHTEITDEPDIGTFGRMAMKSFFSILAPAVWDDTQGELFQTRIIESEEELSASLPSDDNRPASPSEHGSAEKEEFNIFDTSNDYNKPLSAELPDPLPVKISVSDLKKESYEDEIAVGLYTEPEPDALSAPHPDEQPGGTDPSLLPRFLLSDQPSALTGATRGTIYHQVMATLDLAAFHRDADDTMQSAEKTDAPDYPDHVSSLLQTQMKRLVTDHHLPAEEAEVIQPAKIEKFLTSPLGERLITADRKGKLHREQPCILSKPADEIERFRERGETTPIMIQGIIDVYFEEEDGIVLVDYKTDRIRAGEEDSLIRRYRIQMELYREALETVWSKPVKECWLYSFSLNRAIAVDAGGTER